MLTHGVGAASDQWYRPPAGPGRRSRRPRWLVLAGGGAAIGVVVVALVLTLGGHPAKTPAATPSSPAARPSPARSVLPTANPTPTVGNLPLLEFRAGDCLTGSNMELNKNTPWPQLTRAVPCGRSHTAEVFYSNINFWPRNESYPGDTAIKNRANAECNSAFASYDGIAYSKSRYTWTNIVPDAATWTARERDRALHCVAYYATADQPAGRPITGSIRGTKE